MLTVGVDSYVSLEDADSYVKSMYTDDSDLYISWFGLSDTSKEAWLRRSTKALDNLKYQGEKLNYSQRLQFPRTNRNYVGGYGWVWARSPFYDNQHIALSDRGFDDNGMRAISEATIENAVYGVMLDKGTMELTRVNLSGLVSKKAGPISESYNRNALSTSNALKDIFTQKVYTIMVQWLIGSYYGA